MKPNGSLKYATVSLHDRKLSEDLYSLLHSEAGKPGVNLYEAEHVALSGLKQYILGNISDIWTAIHLAAYVAADKNLGIM